MIISSATDIGATDCFRYAWSGLRRFKNVEFTTKKIMQYQGVPTSQRHNVEKQARQIRYCINQAEEYFEAGRVVSLATRPLLYYYGLMSLALAEILIKQDGNASLDRARGQHAHHGLDLRTDADPSRLFRLHESAAALRCVPLERGPRRERFGTFELWHRGSRETPMSGAIRHIYPNGGVQLRHDVIATGTDRRPDLLSSDGVSLLDCFRQLPKLSSILATDGVVSLTARGSLEVEVNHQTELVRYDLVVQPGPDDVLASVYNKFVFHPALCEELSIVEMPSGCVITQQRRIDHPVYDSNFPFGTQITKDSVIFFGGSESLNEFGLLYCALFILGSYARYFPDRWMVDVEQSSHLALVSADFLHLVEERVPLLALSELMQTWHLTDR